MHRLMEVLRVVPNYLVTIDTSDGVMTLVGQTVNGLDALAFSAEQVLYGAGPAVPDFNLYTIDPNTGDASYIGEIGYHVSGLTFVDGTLYGAGWDGFIQIDPTTGAGTFIAPISMDAGGTCADISFAPDGTLYCYNEPGDGWGTIDPGTGAQTWIGYTDLRCCGNGMDVASGGTVYHGNEDGLNTINPLTGAGTALFLWTLPGGIDPDVWEYRPNAFDFDDSGTLYASLHGGHGGSGPTYLVTIDTSNGVMTLVGQTVDGLDALAFTSEPAPTPVSVDSSNNMGVELDTFQIGDPVYAIGSGYAPGTTYDLYIVADTTWTDDMAIPARVSGTESSVTTDTSGNIAAGTLIWASAVQGKYDIVVDVNGNGFYNADTDALDSNVDVGFEAIPEFSTIAIPVASILGLLFLFNHRKRRREQ